MLAHCIHLDAGEKRLLRESGVWIVQNVESNQNNNVGIADYSEFAGHVMLGTDGMHSDMLRSAKAAFLTGQAIEGIGMDTRYERFRNVHTYIAVNRVTATRDNNLVILNYDPPTDSTRTTFWDTLSTGWTLHT